MRTGCAGYVCAAATLETAGDARALAASCWNCLRRSFTGFLPHRQLVALGANVHCPLEPCHFAAVHVASIPRAKFEATAGR